MTTEPIRKNPYNMTTFSGGWEVSIEVWPSYDNPRKILASILVRKEGFTLLRIEGAKLSICFAAAAEVLKSEGL
jgi:hypothetical protein